MPSPKPPSQNSAASLKALDFFPVVVAPALLAYFILLICDLIFQAHIVVISQRVLAMTYLLMSNFIIFGFVQKITARLLGFWLSLFTTIVVAMAFVSVSEPLYTIVVPIVIIWAILGRIMPDRHSAALVLLPSFMLSSVLLLALLLDRSAGLLWDLSLAQSILLLAYIGSVISAGRSTPDQEIVKQFTEKAFFKFSVAKDSQLNDAEDVEGQREVAIAAKRFFNELNLELRKEQRWICQFCLLVCSLICLLTAGRLHLNSALYVTIWVTLLLLNLGLIALSYVVPIKRFSSVFNLSAVAVALAWLSLTLILVSDPVVSSLLLVVFAFLIAGFPWARQGRLLALVLNVALCLVAALNASTNGMLVFAIGVLAVAALSHRAAVQRLKLSATIFNQNLARVYDQPGRDEPEFLQLGLLLGFLVESDFIYVLDISGIRKVYFQGKRIKKSQHRSEIDGNPFWLEIGRLREDHGLIWGEIEAIQEGNSSRAEIKPFFFVRVRLRMQKGGQEERVLLVPMGIIARIIGLDNCARAFSGAARLLRAHFQR